MEEDLKSRDSKQGSTTDFEIEETKPYAELWMGTHPSGPSSICVG